FTDDSNEIPIIDKDEYLQSQATLQFMDSDISMDEFPTIAEEAELDYNIDNPFLNIDNFENVTSRSKSEILIPKDAPLTTLLEKMDQYLELHGFDEHSMYMIYNDLQHLTSSNMDNSSTGKENESNDLIQKDIQKAFRNYTNALIQCQAEQEEVNAI